MLYQCFFFKKPKVKYIKNHTHYTQDVPKGKKIQRINIIKMTKARNTITNLWCTLYKVTVKTTKSENQK